MKRLPSSKAVGPSGWSNDVLKVLPEICIRDLITISKHVLQHGLGPGMMMAKTLLLAKVPEPCKTYHNSQLPLSLDWQICLQGHS